MRKLTRMMDTMNQSSRIVSEGVSKTKKSVSQLGSTATSASSKLGGFATQVSRLHVSSNGLSASLKGAQSTLVGLAGAYLTAQGAAKAFDATIGNAARYEQSEVAVKAIFNDDKKSNAYMKMVDKMAIDSPLLNSTDMLASSKSLVAMTKNVDDLGKAWSIIERLMVLDPTQGTDGAAFALKEMWQGDSLSMVERFGLNKGELNRVKKLAIPQQISEINKMLDGMGITQKTVSSMGETTLGYWAQINERVGKFMRQVGKMGNSKLGATLGQIVKAFDNMDLDGMAAKLDKILASLVDKAIAFGKFVWEWRKPIAYIAGAITAALGAFAIIGTISVLANPISLIAAAISAVAVGFKALYDNSESFRGAINGIIGKVKELWSAFKTGGTSGLIDALFPPGIADKVNGIVDGIKSKVSELMTAFKEGGFGGVFDKLFGDGTFESLKTKFGEVREYIAEKITELSPTFDRLKEIFSTVWSTIVDVLTNAWSIIEPFLSGFWNMLQILGDIAMIVFNNVIMPAISFLAQLFSTLWSVAQPILEGLGIGFELVSTILKRLWDNVLTPFIDFILTGVKNAFDVFTGVLQIVQGAFDSLGGAISTAYGYVKDFIGFLGSVKLPDWLTNGVNAGVSFVGNMFGGDKGGKKSHYSGLDSVPYDGYSARLHKGERVLTARENREYSEGKGGNGSGGGIVVTGNSFTVREEADIEKIAYQLSKLIERQATQVG
ncbi:phage tail tape measure protein [Lysinibacillus sp. CNPSo 3705]|uniref:phage tail protein n=1 Tax=Lysinibacillus sp. CNPSo 3705 TaxID=3028148 RepID=UPI0023647113|nr:phage tail tape measure protein [Lysinibacillus sp. CNPSo 3705]MDD1504735.1 phage tail tape measure protein [Lysinibacillus sp. CNPSo 3705]